MEVSLVQRRTLRLLFVTQVVSGIGIAIGGSVGVLLAADIAGVRVSGVAQSLLVIGAALWRWSRAASWATQDQRFRALITSDWALCCRWSFRGPRLAWA